MVTLLEPAQLEQIERDHANGLPARVIVGIFKPLGVQLSEATFRKYVQVGLLPRSRRVGRKGKHRGSQGLYPVGAVRRLNLIKKMMAEGLTLEQIRNSFVCFRNDVEELERALDALIARQLQGLETRELPREIRRELEREMGEIRKEGRRLVRRLEHVASRVVAGAAVQDASQDDAVDEAWKVDRAGAPRGVPGPG